MKRKDDYDIMIIEALKEFPKFWSVAKSSSNYAEYFNHRTRCMVRDIFIYGYMIGGKQTAIDLKQEIIDALRLAAHNAEEYNKLSQLLISKI